MVNLDDAITARLESHGETFEILLDPKVFDLIKQGKKFDIVEYMAVEDVFKNASKGTRPAEDKIKEAFGTEDVAEIARRIVEKGEIQITAEQRKSLSDTVDKLVKSKEWAEILKARGWEDFYLAGAPFETFLKEEQARVAAPPQGASQREAVARAREHHVEDDDVGAEAVDDGLEPLAVRHRLDDLAVVAQRPGQGLAHGGVVLDDERAGRAGAGGGGGHGTILASGAEAFLKRPRSPSRFRPASDPLPRVFSRRPVAPAGP